MEMRGIPLGKSSKYDIARKRYRDWMNGTKEAFIYKAVLFSMCRGKCPKCNGVMILSYDQKNNNRDDAATLDHVIPLVSILEHRKYGLEIMCRKCNIKKGHTIIQNLEFRNTGEEKEQKYG